MAVITTLTEIRAPAGRVFDLARSVDFHVRSAGSTQETAVAGVTHGLLNLGDEVTWRGRHFGIWQNLTSRIVTYSRPDYFRDSMVRGAFRRLDHDHFFSERDGVTTMKDVFDFTAPFSIFGKIAETVFLTSYMRRFIVQRNADIKRAAEGEDWKSYLGENTP
jgi:ligand-binding SRPBCC domain-containing protein